MAFHLSAFRSTCRPWALVAGGSGGLGAQFASQLVAAGLNLVHVARRKDLFEELAVSLRSRHGIEAIPPWLEMAEADSVPTLIRRIAGMEAGLLVCNASASPLGPCMDQPLDSIGIDAAPRKDNGHELWHTGDGPETAGRRFRCASAAVARPFYAFLPRPSSQDAPREPGCPPEP